MSVGARRRTSLPDPLTAEQRQLCMSRIRGVNTRPEMVIRRGLHALGLRYRLHDRRIPGTPDLVFPGMRGLIFVHGCFWHGHDCPQFRLPRTRTQFWTAKIDRNRERDENVYAEIRSQGWRILTIWECALRSRGRLGYDEVIGQAYHWIVGGLPDANIEGVWNDQ